MKTKQQKGIKVDEKLIKELKDMKSSKLQSLNAVIRFLKDEYDKNRSGGNEM